MKLRRYHNRQSRTGAIAALAAILAIVLVGMVAFSVDVGYVLSVKEELQRSTDASALAACWEFGQRVSNGDTSDVAAQHGRTAAAEFAALNRVTNKAMSLDTNASNNPDGDIVFGYVADFKNSQSPFLTNSPSGYNAVRVRLQKSSSANGEVPYFFARVFGLHGQSLESEAIAGFVRDVNGFQEPSDGSYVDLLPFALDFQTWLNLVGNIGSDHYKWDPATKKISTGADGLVEVNLYPQGTGSPGNRGTVDIGGNNNSTNDIARQILKGISPQDFKDLVATGRSLEFNDSGKLYLNGDTGISAGVKEELATIAGQPRVIPIFESVSQNGNNAEYTIVRWQGIRVMDVELTGEMSRKRVMIQVAPVLTSGIIQAPVSGTSNSVYSSVVLVK